MNARPVLLGDACLDRANSSLSVKLVDGKINSLSTSWYPTGYFTPDEIDRIVNVLLPLKRSAYQALVTVGNRDLDTIQVRVDYTFKLNDIEGQLNAYTKAAATARSRGGLVDAPNLRAFAIKSLLVISEALVTASVHDCSMSKWDAAAPALNSATAVIGSIAGVAADVAKRVGTAVITAVETTSKLVAFFIKAAPFLALGIGAYFVYGLLKRRGLLPEAKGDLQGPRKAIPADVRRAIEQNAMEFIQDSYNSMVRAKQYGANVKEPTLTVGLITDYLRQAHMPEDFRWATKQQQRTWTRSVLEALRRKGKISSSFGDRARLYQPG